MCVNHLIVSFRVYRKLTGRFLQAGKWKRFKYTLFYYKYKFIQVIEFREFITTNSYHITAETLKFLVYQHLQSHFIVHLNFINFPLRLHTQKKDDTKIAMNRFRNLVFLFVIY